MLNEKASAPRIAWDIGTAYDFFVSLMVLHHPEDFGLRGSWAAGVRSRLPIDERKFLENIDDFSFVSHKWIYDLPEPKDATAALWALRQIPAEERLPRTNLGHRQCGEMDNILLDVATRRSYTQKDVEAVKEAIRKCEKAVKIKMVANMVDWWSRPDEYGELFLNAMQSYYQNFFAEEEKRIAPVLKKSLEQAQELARKMPVIELVENLSQGVHFEKALDYPELVLVPSFWSTPFIMWNQEPGRRMIMTFGGRPADMSLIPGEDVPDNTLRVLKALADPTRLKIMRYLAHEHLTPAQLAQKLRLRAPTVIHHLDILRMAGLVHIAMGEGGKRYTARQEAINNTFNNLESFLDIQ
jgi:DNA-binding transcriptional ArsR family regulator